MLTDEELVKKAQSGDKSAETEILERYKGVVRSKARGYFLSMGEYDDLIQEGMIGLTNAISSYSTDKGASFRSFSILCIKRHIYDVIRKDCSKKNEPMKDFVPIDLFADPECEDGFKGKEIEAEGSNPEEIYIKKENYDSLMSAIRDNLKSEDYEVLRYYLQGSTYREIGDNTGLSTKAVDNAIQRIKKKISRLQSSGNFFL